MDKEMFNKIADHIASAHNAATIMKQLLEFKERKLVDHDSFLELYKQEAEKLSNDLASIVMLTGLDDMLKESLVQ